MTIEQVRLNDGQLFPLIELGTVGIRGQQGKLAILDAIQAGYRSIDTSTNYNNEGMVGQAVAEAGVSRADLFITSKLPGSAHRFDDALMMIQEQLARTGLTYFDKYLIHWPNPDDGLYVEAWQALIQAQKLGWIRSIGVSNFEKEHLDQIIDQTGVVPAVNQIESHPYFNNQPLHLYNQQLGIVSEAWSPTGRDKNDLKENPTLQAIADTHDKSIAQVIVRWLYQRQWITVIKSADPLHQRDNLAVFDFELSPEEMDTINQLDQGESGRVEGQNPHDYHEYV